MIAPSNVQFFNTNWTCIEDKKTFALTLTNITGVPMHILKEGLAGNRPCVAQIMSWAAYRTTNSTRGQSVLLDGTGGREHADVVWRGRKAFHRLQLEIIRTSNHQNIFAWGNMTV